MDIGYLWNILWRRKWLVATSMAVAGVLAFVVVTMLPSRYESSALIETGILNYKGIVIERESAFVQKFQIESSFNQLIEFMKSRTILHRLGTRLLAHDLQSPTPFRQPEDLAALQNLSPQFIESIAVALPQDTNSWQMDRRLKELARAFGYDYESLLEHLTIQRKGDTDYLEVVFSFESPELAHFAATAYLEEFFNIYEQELISDEQKSLAFWQKQAEEKKARLEAKMAEIEAYRQSNDVVDISRQKESLLGHIRELELERERMEQKIPALERAIERLNRYILERNHVKGDAFARAVFLNQDVQSLTRQIKELQAQYLKGGRKDERLARRIAALRQRQESLIARLAALRKEGGEQAEERTEDLLKERIDKELELELARAAVASLEREIARLRSQSNKLVTWDAELTRLEQERQVLEKEYLEVVEKLKEARLQTEHQEVPLRIVEPPVLPDEPKPKNRVLISAFASIASGGFMVLLILLTAFLDTTLYSPEVFVRRTGLPLLAAIVEIRHKELDLTACFRAPRLPHRQARFREGIRTLRHGIHSSGRQIILFTSLEKAAGKSFLILNTANALALQDKRVLIVDTNLRHNTLSTFQRPDHASRPRPTGALGIVPTSIHKRVTIIGNKCSDQSPLEVFAEAQLGKMLAHYRAHFDYIFLEGAALNHYPDSKELSIFADGIVLVCAARETIDNQGQYSLEYLKSLGDKVLGGVLNMVDIRNL